MSSAEDFKKNKYVVAEGLLDANLVTYLKSYYQQLLGKGRSHFDRDGTSLNGYGEACADALLHAMRAKVESVTGLELNPGFSFVRVYRKGEKLRRHIDRGANEINCTIQISAPVPWALGVEVDGQKVIINQSSGDALIYRGLEIPHWRDKYEGEEHLQLILAYVVRGGENDHFSFDGKAGPYYAPSAARTTLKKRLMYAGAQLKRKLTGQEPLP